MEQDFEESNDPRDSVAVNVSIKLKSSLKTLSDLIEMRMRWVLIYSVIGLVIYLSVGSSIYHNWVRNKKNHHMS